MVKARQAPKTEKLTNRMPISSLKVRNSMTFRSQLSLCSLDLYSGRHLSHFTASENTDMLKLCSHIFRQRGKVLAVILPNRNEMSTSVKTMIPAVSLSLLLNSPSAQRMQSKQQMGLPLTKARRVPGKQLSLHTERGTCKQTHNQFRILLTNYCVI